MKIIVCLLLAVSLASSEHCPSGWIDALDLGCLYFGSEHTTWLEASLYCEELMNSSSSMIEIFSQDENDLLSLIGTLELSLTGADGWWIGLDDIGHEGEYGNGSHPQPWHHIFLGQKIDQALTLSTEMIVSLCLWICLKMNLFGLMISVTVKAMM